MPTAYVGDLMDHVTREVRSKIMAAVPSRNGKTTELALAKAMRAAGIRGYRRQWPVDGKPDFAWPGLRIAVFVDGCFWHGCTRCKYPPRTNQRFWVEKFENNQRRDRKVSQRLRRAGWCVIRIRECVVKSPATIARIERAVAARRASLTPANG